jgi:hypothetical protein
VVRAKTLEELVLDAHEKGFGVEVSLEPVLRVEVTRNMEAEPSWLVSSGLFGGSIAEAARRILEEWLWNNKQRIAALRPNARTEPPPTGDSGTPKTL